MSSERQEKIIGGEGDDIVAEALKALPRVDAPGDFEMRVKARIAEEQSDSKPRILGLPRFALAFTALVVIVTGVAIFVIVRKGADEVAGSSDLEKAVPPIASEAPTAPLVNGSSNKIEVARTEANSSENSAGGVREEAAKQAETIDLGNKSKQPVAGQSAETVGVTDAMLSIGAEVSFEGGAWVVRDVRGAGRALSSGLKKGDAVFAVDGITLARETRLESPFAGRMLLVKRPGSDKLLPLPIK